MGDEGGGRGDVVVVARRREQLCMKQKEEQEKGRKRNPGECEDWKEPEQCSCGRSSLYAEDDDALRPVYGEVDILDESAYFQYA